MNDVQTFQVLLVKDAKFCKLRYKIVVYGLFKKKIGTRLTTRRGRKSLPSRLKANTAPKTKLKIVLMPRSECERLFARNEKGSYIGTEEERTWTEQELEDRYGKCKAALPAASMRYQSPEKVTGGYGLS
jgi:hypothetical protein